MPFDESLLTPVEGGFDESLLEPEGEPLGGRNTASGDIFDEIVPDAREQKGKELRAQMSGVRGEVIPKLARGFSATVEAPGKLLRSMDEDFNTPAENIIPYRHLAQGADQFGTVPQIIPPGHMETPEVPISPKAQEMGDIKALREHIRELGPDEHPALTAAARTAEGLRQGLIRPSGVIPLLATAVAPEVMAPFWMIQGSQGVHDSVEKIRESRKEGNSKKYWEGVYELGVNLPAAMGGTKGTLNTIPGRIALPRSLAAVAETQPEITTEKEPNAIQKQSTEEVLRDVPKQPSEIAREVSAEKGAGRVPQRDVSQETTGGTEVPLNPKTVDTETLRNLGPSEVQEGFLQKKFGTQYDSEEGLRKRADTYLGTPPEKLNPELFIKTPAQELKLAVRDADPSMDLTRGSEWATLEAARTLKNPKELFGRMVDAITNTKKEYAKTWTDYLNAIEEGNNNNPVVAENAALGLKQQVILEGLEAVGNYGEHFGVPKDVVKAAQEAYIASKKISFKDFLDESQAKEVTDSEKETQGKKEGVLTQPGGAQPAPESVPHIVPGAAHISEFEPEKSQLIRTAFEQANERSKQRGGPELTTPDVESGQKVWEHAQKLISEDSGIQDRLIKEITNTGAPVNWLDLNTQDALLRHRYVDLENDLEKAKNRLFEAQETGDPVAIREQQLRFSSIISDLDELDVANKMLGTQLGRGLQARKNWANQDFSLVKMLGDKRASLGRKLTPKEEAEVSVKSEDLNKKAAEVNSAIQKESQKQRETFGNDAVEESGKTARKEDSSDEKAGVERDYGAEKEALINGLRERFMQQDGSLEGSNKSIRKLMELLYREGITDRVGQEKAIQEIINKSVDPTMSLQDIQDLMSGYGKYKQLSKDPIKVGVRDIVGQIQQVRKLLDFFQSKAPSKTGVERRIPSEIERNWIKVVNEAKKVFGVITTDPAKALKSAIDSINTRLKNRILDLQQEISTRKKIIRERNPSPYNEETLRLRNELEELKKQHTEIFGKPQLTDAQRLAIAEKSAQRQIESLEEQLKSGEIFPKGERPEGQTSEKLQAAKARIEELKAEREWARETLQPSMEPEARKLLYIRLRYLAKEVEYKNRLAEGDFDPSKRKVTEPDRATLETKARYENAKLAWRRGLEANRLAQRSLPVRVSDAIAKWKRTAVLLAPTSLAKLTAAAFEGIGTSTIEEAAGTLVSKVIPKSVTSKAARYGEGLKISNEVKAYSDTWLNLIKNFESARKTGNMQIDLLHGKPDIAPRTMLDWVGNLHYALKTPLMQFEYSKSFQVLMEHARRNGVDITDSGVVQRIGNEAYRHAEERLFLESNIVVDMYRNALRRAMQAEKETGKPTFTGKLVETALRYEYPIVVIPTNLVKRTFEYSLGSLTGSARLGRAFIRGIDNLSPAEADAIMRNFRRGLVGTSLLLYGFFNPQQFGGYYQEGKKRQPGEVPYGGARIGGVEIPRVVLHNPLMEQLQIGATIRRVADSTLRKKDPEAQGISAGAWAALMGLTDEVPFAREIKDSIRNLKDKNTFIGEMVKSSIPGFVQWLAQQSDKDQYGNPIKRKPETITQHIETGIPVLRQDVPASRVQPVQ